MSHQATTGRQTSSCLCRPSGMPRLFSATLVALSIFGAVCLCQARQTPGHGPAMPSVASSVDSSQQRALLADKRAHHATSSRQHRVVATPRQAHINQLTNGVDPPPFVGADVPTGPRVNQMQLPPNDVPPAFNGGGGFRTGGTPNWLNIAGVTVNAVDYGVNVGTQLLAPVVNGVASNIPLLAPALPDGSCMRGSPLFVPRLNVVMCVVGNGASVTNYLFNAANALVGVTSQGLNLAGQIASVAAGK